MCHHHGAYLLHGGILQGSDAAVAALVRLLIIDEVHLLNDDRGAVIETLVSRTQRQARCRPASPLLHLDTDSYRHPKFQPNVQLCGLHLVDQIAFVQGTRYPSKFVRRNPLKYSLAAANLYQLVEVSALANKWLTLAEILRW